MQQLKKFCKIEKGNSDLLNFTQTIKLYRWNWIDIVGTCRYVRIFNLWCIFITRHFFSNLQVALRIRPMNEDEILMGATQIAHKVQKKVLVKKKKCEKLKSKEKSKVWRYIYVVKKIKALGTHTCKKLLNWTIIH